MNNQLNQSSDNQQQGVNAQGTAPSQTNSGLFPWLQILLFIIFTISYININGLNIWAFLLFNVSLLSINLFAPSAAIIETINAHIERAIRTVLHTLKRRLHFLSFTKVSSRQGAKKTSIRVVSFWVLSILVVIFFLLQNFFINVLHTTLDRACITGSVPIVCSPDIGVSTLMAPDYTTVKVGLITSGNETDLPFDWSGSSGADQEKEVEKKILEEQDIQKHACSGTHITLAVVTMLSRTVSDPDLSANVGLEDLRGAYLAQKDYNSQHNQENAKLCLVIANIGTLATGQEALHLIVKQLALFSKSDPSFRGIIGLPFSVQVKQAFDAFKEWGAQRLPIVSPSATSDDFSNEPNFYRIASPDDSQSNMIARFIEQYFVPKSPCLQAKPTIAVFYDINKGVNQPDPYSNSLAKAFITAIQNKGVCANSISEPYIIGDSNTIEAEVQDAILNKGATMIFFAGYANDIDAVEYGVQLAQQQRKPPASKAPIPIFAGDGVYDLTRYIDNAASIVYSTIYAPPLNTNDNFVQKYTVAFPQVLPSPGTIGLNNYTLLPPHAILSYDATRAFLQAFENTPNKNDQESFNSHLAAVEFAGINQEDIVFQGNNPGHSSDPTHKSVYILCTDHTHAIQVAAASDTNSYPPLKDVWQCSR